MTPYSSMSRSYPPSGAVSASASARPVTHPNSSVPERWPQNVVIDLTENEYGSSRPAKRQKLEAGSDDAHTVDVPDSADVQSSTIAPNLVNTFPNSGSGRPPWSFGDELPLVPLEGGISTRSLEEGPQSSATLPPFPVRPWTYCPPPNNPGGGPGPECSAGVNNVQIVPYNLETPKVAPLFELDKAADFHPWCGSHPEDSLTEQTAKQGYFDHVQVSQNESNTARPSLYAQFKNRSGLKILSSVFTIALEKRQAHTKVSESSTFKPPPRVTLTDMKREAWLRDLANPSVPLRKLSRTIPHGIRGKSLLDQCLSKNIPIGRALWLAKCVGANEIRAFKRKGTTPVVASGLESKWVRDWTVNVIQFLEGVIGGCGVEGWRAHFNYAMRLSSRFFLDNLLDQDHFLEWLLFSLENAPPDALPIWLLMTRLYWRNLVRYRTRGRRVAECLLEKLRGVCASDNDGALKPLCERLSSLIKGLVLSQPSCFILSKTWSKYESTLASCFDLANAGVKAFFARLSNRNAQISKVKSSFRHTLGFPSRQLIRLLDSAILNYSTQLSTECLNLQLDHASLISTVLRWASTPFRSGLARVYIAVKLLRRWNRSGTDTDAHILGFLTSNDHCPRTRFINVYHVVSELVRSRSFSVGRYLQWLMARGVVSHFSGQDMQHTPRDVQFLSHIPSRHLPTHVWNLRNTLLERACFSVTTEKRLIDVIKSYLQRQVPEICGAAPPSQEPEMEQDFDFCSLNWTVRSEIAQHLRGHVASYLKSCKRDDSNTTSGDEVSAFSSKMLCRLRHILECLEDLSVLMDVLQQASHVDDNDVLVATLDTLNYHFDSFVAIGAAGDLFKSCFAAYNRMTGSDIPTLELTSSLLEIGIKLPAELSTIAVLRRDVARLDKKYGMAASSPVSDHMTDTLNPINPTFPNSLEQVLLSGNSMDEPTTVRIFDLLVQSLTSDKSDSKLSPNETARYLARLRTFNAKFYDNLMIKRVITTVTSQPRPKLSTFLPPLIGVGSITLPAFFALVQGLLNPRSGEESIPDEAALRFEMLDLLKSAHAGTNAFLDMVSYRYRTAREEYMSQYPHDILGFINDSLANTSAPEAASTQNDDQGSCLTAHATPIIRELIIKASGRSDREPASLILHNFPFCRHALQQAVTLLLGSRPQSSVSAAQETLQLIDDFSLPYCLAKFQLLCDAESDGETKKGILDMVIRAAESDIRHGAPRWADVLGVLQPEAAQQIRQRAEQGLLTIVLTEPQPNDREIDGVGSLSEQTGLAYLLIVEELGWTISDDEASSLGSALFEKLDLLLQTIVMVSNDPRNGEEPVKGCNIDGQHPSSQESTCCFWFYALLRLVVMHRSIPLAGGFASKADVTDQSRLLLILCCIAMSPLFSERLDEHCHIFPHLSVPWSNFQRNLPSTRRDLRTYALDVASSLVDTLPDDIRQSCARFLRERCSPNFHPHNNPYLLHLLGPIPESQAPVSAQVGVGSPVHNNNAPISHPQTQAQSAVPYSASAVPPSAVEDPTSLTNKLQFQQGGRIVGSCPSRPWEMLEESAPILGVNDTALNLAYFGTRQVRG